MYVGERRIMIIVFSVIENLKIKTYINKNSHFYLALITIRELLQKNIYRMNLSGFSG